MADRRARQPMAPLSEHSAELNFPTTCWTVVLQAARDDGPEADDAEVRGARQSLCRDYRGPVVAFALARGVAAADVESLADDFFAGFIGGDGLAKVDQAKGRLRAYLLAALEDTVRNYLQAERSGERAGSAEPASLEQVAEYTGGKDRVESDPAHAYDRAWAENLMDRALKAVLESRAWRNQTALFEDLVPLVDGTGDGPAVRREICKRHRLDADALTNLLHRLHHRLRVEVRVLISATVETEEAVDEELRDLARLLAE